MTDPSTLIQQHAGTIIATLAAQLKAPDPRDRLRAAKLLLRWGWGVSDRKRTAANRAEVVPAGGLSYAEQQRAVELLLPHVRPGQKARSERQPHAQRDTRTPGRPGRAPTEGENPDANPMSREPKAVAAPAATPPAPAVPAPNPARRDADPMSRRAWPDRHSADDPFYRPLPPPAPMEPPWPFGPASLDRRKRWPPWR